MRGRKPIPERLKLVKGTARKSRQRNQLVVDPAIPDPPKHLSPEALGEWNVVAPKLLEQGILTSLDRAALAAYCQAYGRWVQAERTLARFAAKDSATSGLMIKTTNGNPIMNPVLATANRAQADMVRYAAEFGMSPSSRSRVSADLKHDKSVTRFFE